MSGSNLASSASAGHPRRFLRQGRTRHTLARRNRVAMPARAAHQGVVAAVPRPRGHGRRRSDGRHLCIIVIEPGRRGPGMRPRHARAGSRRLRKGNESNRRRRLPGRGRGREREGGAGERGHRSGERIGRRDQLPCASPLPIDVRLGDGAEALVAEDGVDVVCVAGVGGRTMVKMLKAAGLHQRLRHARNRDDDDDA